MAYTNEILVGRINRGLQKLFGIKGPAPVPQLASDVQPVHPLFTGVENRFIDSWRRLGNGASIGAQGVGNSSAILLRNPQNSNVIVVVEKAWVSNNGPGATFDLRVVSLDLATVQQSRRLDGREGLPGATSITAIVSLGFTVLPTLGILGAAAGAAAGFGQTDFIITDDQEITVAPGDGVVVVATATNTGITAGYVWRERALEESERT